MSRLVFSRGPGCYFHSMSGEIQAAAGGPRQKPAHAEQYAVSLLAVVAAILMLQEARAERAVAAASLPLRWHFVND